MWLAWAHPAFGVVAVLLAARGAALGVAGRRSGVVASRDRARHKAFMPWVYALVVVSWAGGLASTLWLRTDLPPAESAHFLVGTGIVIAFTAAAAISRRIGLEPWARQIHPWIGAAALLLCGWQLFLGLQIMPH
jgi:hypothetical protein